MYLSSAQRQLLTTSRQAIRRTACTDPGKEPETLIRLAEGGVEIPKVDLGIMFNEDGRTPVTRFIALDDKEKADLATIKGMGIPVVIQYVPTDAEEVYEG